MPKPASRHSNVYFAVAITGLSRAITAASSRLSRRRCARTRPLDGTCACRQKASPSLRKSTIRPACSGLCSGELASPLVVDGVRRYYLIHTALPRLAEALSNLGFGRDGVYGVQRSAPRRSSSVVAVRVAGVEDLESIARLALVEIQHRSAAPMFAPRHDPPLSDLVEEHHALHDAGAVHLVAALDGRDVGLLTVELTSPVPRLCPDGQPYIGPTVTLPDVRGRGVGRSLVDAALNWTYSHGYQWISVDFASANPLSRPFWLNAGFRPTGYGVFRLIDSGIDGPPP